MIYELCWQRCLGDLLGSDARSGALTIGMLLAGLGIGSGAFGRFCRTAAGPRRLFRMFAAAQTGSGIWGLIFLPLCREYGARVDPAVRAVFGPLESDLLCAGFLLLPPSFLLGASMPILAELFSRLSGANYGRAEALDGHAASYAINTAGALCGCLLGGFYLLPQFGIERTILAAALANFICGLMFFMIGGKDKAPALPYFPLRLKRGFRQTSVLALFSFCGGAALVSVQIAVCRVAGLSAGGSEYLFCLVVAVFVALTAAGIALAPRLARYPGILWINQCAVLIGLFCVYQSVPSWPYWAHFLRIRVGGGLSDFYLYQLALGGLLALLLALPLLAAGASMPLLFAAVIENGKDRGRAGAAAGFVYSINGLGSAAGAAAGGCILLQFGNLDLVWRAALLLTAMTVAAAALITFSRRPLLYPAGAVLAAALPFLIQPWPKLPLSSGAWRLQHPRDESYAGPQAFYRAVLSGGRLKDYRDDPSSSAAVLDLPANDNSYKLYPEAELRRSLLINGRVDAEASFGDTVTMRLLAHLGGLFAAAPLKSAAVVGFGSGVSAGSFTLYPEIKRIDCIELSTAVRDFSKYFDFANYSVRTDKRLNWMIGDAYRVLAQVDRSYSVIVSEPSHLWAHGVERLYSAEFYQTVRSHLSPGGVFVQWIHGYSLSTTTFEIFLRTFSRQWPQFRAFYGGPDDLLFVGVNAAGGAKEQLKWLNRNYEIHPHVRQALAEIGIGSVPELLGREIWLTADTAAPGPEQTLGLPKIAYAAAIDRFSENWVDIVGLVNGSSATAAAGKKSLAAAWLASGRRLGAEFAQSACGKDRLEYFADWRSSLPPCRQAIMAQILSGTIPPGQWLSAAELAAVRQLGQSDASSASLPIPAPQLILLFNQFNSPIVPLSTDALCKMAAQGSEALANACAADAPDKSAAGKK